MDNEIAQNLTVGRYYIALFPNDFYISDMEDFFGRLKNELTDFDGDNQLISLPIDVPRDIPRISMQSKDGILGLDIAFDKIAIAWKNPTNDPNFIIEENKISELIEKICKTVIPSNTIQRVGFVFTFVKSTTDSIKEVENKVLTAKISQSLSSYQLRLIYKKVVAEKTYNQIITLESGMVLDAADKNPALVYQSDLNTNKEDKLKLYPTQVIDFIKDAFSGGFADKESLYKQIIE